MLRNKFTVELMIIIIGVFTLVILFPYQLLGQVKPAIYSKNPKSSKNDDKQLCKSSGALEEDSFCDFYKNYKEQIDNANPVKAAEYRNKMIYLIKGQIDEYYNAYKNGNVKKVKWFQWVLDVLEIALDLTGTITNGERAKTVIAAVAGSFQAGRNALNNRFNLLQQQILINKMNANRLEQWTQIRKKMDSGVSANFYTWEEAKDDLQQYFFRGNFVDALDYLVAETGAEVKEADEKLKNVEGAVSNSQFQRKSTNFDLIVAMDAQAVQLEKDIENLTEKIKQIDDELKKDGLTDARKTELQKEKGDLEGQKTSKTSQITTLNEEIKELTRKIEDIDKKLKDDSISESAKEGFRDEREKLDKERSEKVSKVSTLEGEIKNINQRIKEIDDEIAKDVLTDKRKEELTKEKETLEKQKMDKETALKGLRERYEKIWQAIKSSGDFEVIDLRIKKEFANDEMVIERYKAFLKNFDNTANRPTIPLVEYDFVLTKVNAVVGEDEKLNEKFLEILKTNRQ